METPVYGEVSKIWKALSRDSKRVAIDFELEIHKKLLSFFQVGGYYYFMVDIKDAKFDVVSKEFFELMGYKGEEVDIPFVINLIHPDDLHWFLNFENKITEFINTLAPEKIFKYKIRYDYRVRKQSGEYIRILQQVITLQTDEDGGVYRTLSMHTDITHLKDSERPILSFIGLDGEPSYIDVKVDEVYKINHPLSKRERDVIYLLIEGKPSKEIADILYISKQTVDTHRKNLLRKANAKNVSELIAKAIQYGWV